MPDRRKKSSPGISKKPFATGSTGEQWTLEAVGVSKIEQQLYEILLDSPGVTIAVLVVSTTFSRRKVQLVLEALELKGLATHSPDRNRHYFPTPPDVAMEALISKQEEALKQVRVAASHLRERARKARGSLNAEKRLVEIITGREAQTEIFSQIQRGAQKEVICFDRPPYVAATSVANKAELEMMAYGVRCRGVYDRSALEFPGAADRIFTCINSGEEARVFQSVPLKLIGADHRIAMLPLDLHYIEGAALLVRPGSLLDALYELFETIWSRAAPISFNPSGLMKIGKATTNSLANIEHLVPLLASGLNDKVIADQLGISKRTLDRYMKEFMAGLDARTRFQAGWLAALRLDTGIK